MSRKRIFQNMRLILARYALQQLNSLYLTEGKTFSFQIPPTEFPSTYKDKLAQIEADRRVVRKEHQEAYEKALVYVKDELAEKEGPDIEEQMKEEIRDWFLRDR